MRDCEECGRSFSWKQAFLAQWRLTPVVCISCRSQHEIHASARLLFSFAVLAPAVYAGAYLAPFGQFQNLLLAAFVMISASLFVPLFFPFRLTLNGMTNDRKE